MWEYAIFLYVCVRVFQMCDNPKLVVQWSQNHIALRPQSTQSITIVSLFHLRMIWLGHKTMYMYYKLLCMDLSCFFYIFRIICISRIFNLPYSVGVLFYLFFARIWSHHKTHLTCRRFTLKKKFIGKIFAVIEIVGAIQFSTKMCINRQR